MIITKTSMVSGEVHSMDLPITIAQLDAYNNGELVQRAFPNLSAAEREFLLTGITPDEWKDIFGAEEDEE